MYILLPSPEYTFSQGNRVHEELGYRMRTRGTGVLWRVTARLYTVECRDQKRENIKLREVRSPLSGAVSLLTAG